MNELFFPQLANAGRYTTIHSIQWNRRSGVIRSVAVLYPERRDVEFARALKRKSKVRAHSDLLYF